MIVGIVLGVIGCLIAIFALKCLKMGNMEDNIKATMTLTAGILFLLAGCSNVCLQRLVPLLQLHLFYSIHCVFLIFRGLWHCWRVCLCQLDCAEFSVHVICWWRVWYVWRRCWWTYGSSDSKVRLSYKDIFFYILQHFVMFSCNHCLLSGTLLAPLFSLAGLVVLYWSLEASWCVWPAVEWLQITSKGTSHHWGK